VSRGIWGPAGQGDKQVELYLGLLVEVHAGLGHAHDLGRAGDARREQLIHGRGPASDDDADHDQGDPDHGQDAAGEDHGSAGERDPAERDGHARPYGQEDAAGDDQPEA
jgi:hypothetical protein